MADEKALKLNGRGKVVITDAEGVQHQAKMPTLAQSETFEESIKAVGKDTRGYHHCVREFLTACGLTEVFVNDLSTEDAETILKTLTGFQKKA